MPKVDLRPAGRRRSGPILVAQMAAIVLLVGAGLVHGRLTNRWGTPEALIAAVARLDRLPLVIGDWTGRDSTMDPKQIERAGILGYKARTYHNARDGRDWTVLLVCGRPGPIAVHTPDICYVGMGFRAIGTPEAIRLGGRDEAGPRGLHSTFRKDSGAMPELLRIFWSWDGGEAWEAPTNPRLAFAHRPSLYKIYLVERGDAARTAEAATPPHDWHDAGPFLDAIRLVLSERGPSDVSLPETPRIAVRPTFSASSDKPHRD